MDRGSTDGRRELVAMFTYFCDGVEESGMTRYAQIGRRVADELSRTLDELEAERSVRVAVQAKADRFEALWRAAATGAEVAA